ncbi:hypothetical protein L9F63_007320, partial [Diploptera punctata]
NLSLNLFLSFFNLHLLINIHKIYYINQTNLRFFFRRASFEIYSDIGNLGSFTNCEGTAAK